MTAALQCDLPLQWFPLGLGSDDQLFSDSATETSCGWRFLFQTASQSVRWYVVWQLFLSKFKFLRELLGDTGSQHGDIEESEKDTEREMLSTPRHRPKSARQRKLLTEETT
ncbi:small integral membrane protein 13 isoform X1 [Erpetoichthys calabaricus]|uniref:small integral membrane protein 13 isoform X1 n=1 Tax=Erpetoichthys calabaricus TaxID=27687 RepID=UPI0022343CEE|nr:small integral membrane protein 13 isoform X1 [Erpetoichthys calabaricus]